MVFGVILAGGTGRQGHVAVIECGMTCNETIMNSITYIEENYGLDDSTVIETHDSVRPFLTYRIIEENIKYGLKYGAVDTVVPATDTIVSKAMFPGTKLYIFGTDREKLSRFSFAEETFLVAYIPEDISVDHAFECVGGSASQKAVNQIIGCIEPEGTISLLGVSEYPVPVNTLWQK